MILGIVNELMENDSSISSSDDSVLETAAVSKPNAHISETNIEFQPPTLKMGVNQPQEFSPLAANLLTLGGVNYVVDGKFRDELIYTWT